MQIKFQQLLLAATLALSGAMLPLVPAHGNDPGGCFLIDESGNTISLSSLCGFDAARNSSNNEKAANNGVVKVPIIRRAGLTPIIAVSFNDSQTYEMILDTGASGTLITRNMAEDLNLRPNGEIIASIADGSKVRFPTGRVNTIAVDGAKVSDVDVAIAEGISIGLLGHDFFGNFDIRIGKDVVEFSPQS